MILFVDFDGVLHPVYKGIAGSTDFRQLPLLEDWLREHKNVNIVISSSWREVMDLEVLQHIFSEDLRERVIDKCPVVLGELDEEGGQSLPFWRYQEIMQWITQSNYVGEWLALDDAVHEFPEYFERLVACNKSVGIDEGVLKELTEKAARYG